MVLDVVIIRFEGFEVDPHAAAELHPRILDFGHIGQLALDIVQAGPASEGEESLFVQVGTGVARNANVIEIVGSNSRLLQTVLDRLGRKTRAILYAAESFLFRGGKQSTVLD